MPLLYHWRGDNYRRDLDFGVSYHLNQANPLLHEIELGDSLWAFTRRRDGVYVLAAELVIRSKTMNPNDFRYGKYRVWGDLDRSRYFDTAHQPDITTLIRGLSPKAGGDVLGRAFQGRAAVRRLDERDHQILSEYTAGFPLEYRAQLLPEEKLESLLLTGDGKAVEHLLREQPDRVAEERQEYLVTRAQYPRDRGLVNQLRTLYEGRCQICSWSPRSSYGVDLCEAHHVRWLSRGGDDALENMVLICPNHHRAIHLCDAQYDWGLESFVYPDGREHLNQIQHDLVP